MGQVPTRTSSRSRTPTNTLNARARSSSPSPTVPPGPSEHGGRQDRSELLATPARRSSAFRARARPCRSARMFYSLSRRERMLVTSAVSRSCGPIYISHSQRSMRGQRQRRTRRERKGFAGCAASAVIACAERECTFGAAPTGESLSCSSTARRGMRLGSSLTALPPMAGTASASPDRRSRQLIAAGQPAAGALRPSTPQHDRTAKPGSSKRELGHASGG